MILLSPGERMRLLGSEVTRWLCGPVHHWIGDTAFLCGESMSYPVLVLDIPRVLSVFVPEFSEGHENMRIQQLNIPAENESSSWTNYLSWSVQCVPKCSCQRDDVEYLNLDFLNLLITPSVHSSKNIHSLILQDRVKKVMSTEFTVSTMFQ